MNESPARIENDGFVHRLMLCFIAASLVTDVTFCRSEGVTDSPDFRSLVTQTVGPVMARYGVPGMAVGLTIDGRHYIFNYGIMSKATGKRVDASTLFEIGSVTKTFTATLASYAAETGRLKLSDAVSSDLRVL